jgi:hypothetical protein
MGGCPPLRGSERNMKTKLKLISSVVLTLGGLTGTAVAEPIGDFNETITQAVLTSPRVNTSGGNVEAATEAERAAVGGY